MAEDFPILVSVIVPAHNAAATLERALVSVNAQGVEGIETIVVDDGSSDKTARIAEAAGTKLIRLPQTVGPAAARNHGIAASRGEFVAFLDADDEWLSGHLTRGLEPMLEDRSVGMTYCHALLKRSDGTEAVRKIDSPLRRGRHRLLWPDPVQCTPGTTIRRTVLDQAGWFDEALATREDQDLYIRVAEISRVVEIEKPLAVVHESGRGYSTRHSLEQMAGDYFRIIDKALARCPERYARHRTEIVTEGLTYWGWFALFRGNRALAREQFSKSLKMKSVANPLGLAGYIACRLPNSAIGLWRRFWRP